ncbi:MAG: 23S rRNA (uracil(1939)-C(5))-methyltransferase RlmD [Bacteroidales bacterium]|nr:23S rRNA (uracil(1939)-C(5))-methyltransferase RlmD [Bacteroidales bacterium]MBN2755953.1 23S rRNA (uracil(1939)-C(5))-methyltransferase RlmD [Bacteroidales bacterium]
MRRTNRKRLPRYENVEIIDLAAEGKAIAKLKIGDDEREIIVFVKDCIPGDIVDIQVDRKKKSFMEAYPVKFHKLSDVRIDAKCSHFGVCGGCKWQSLPYQKQIEYKHKQVVDQLTHIGGIELPEAEKILESNEEFYYRNKLEYTFSNKRWLTKEEISDETPKQMDALGFHIPKMFDKIVDIETCYLQNDSSNDIRLEIRKYAIENKLEFFDLKNNKGFLRNLIIRSSTTGDLMVILSLHYDDINLRKALLNHIKEKFPEITSLMYAINPKRNDTITDLPVKLHHGNDHIYEKMEDLKFKIGPKSFYQTNSKQAYRLYTLVREYADLKGDEIVYDLYTGTGTIANFVAKNAKQVIGIEYVPEAIEDAKVNSEINEIENTTFYAGDMKDVMTKDFIKENGKPDVIILDPPRAGMHKDVVDAILFAEPEKIVYVSCNAATQARDIKLLDEKYKVVKYRPVDMFPQTAHVENIALLHKK